MLPLKVHQEKLYVEISVVQTAWPDYSFRPLNNTALVKHTTDTEEAVG